MGILTKLGPSYGGTAYSFPADRIDELFGSNDLELSDSFYKSLMRECEIPPNFFTTLPSRVQEEIVQVRKSTFEEKSVDGTGLVLEKDGKIVFSAPNRCGYQDPEQRGFNDRGNWVLRKSSYESGIFSYFGLGDDPELEEWNFGAFYTHSIFGVQKDVLVSGCYRPVCSNGLMEFDNSGKFAVSLKNHSDLLSRIPEAIRKAVVDGSDRYSGFFKILENKELDLDRCRENLGRYQSGKIFPKKMMKSAKEIVDRLRSGVEPEREAPQEIKSYKDELDLITYVSNRMIDDPDKLMAQDSYNFSHYKSVVEENGVDSLESIPNLDRAVENAYGKEGLN